MDRPHPLPAWGRALPSRRRCRVRVVNIVEPIDLYELVGQPVSALG